MYIIIKKSKLSNKFHITVKYLTLKYKRQKRNKHPKKKNIKQIKMAAKIHSATKFNYRTRHKKDKNK